MKSTLVKTPVTPDLEKTPLLVRQKDSVIFHAQTKNIWHNKTR